MRETIEAQLAEQPAAPAAEETSYEDLHALYVEQSKAAQDSPEARIAREATLNLLLDRAAEHKSGRAYIITSTPGEPTTWVPAPGYRIGAASYVGGPRITF